ncbi:MAG: hypothetical protein ACW987_18020 [Candidatus Thorarchaeota archaeon]|jgi:hypothetical protein
MGFQDNSGEIFIDAVLTDLGREKLARNDGSFEIVAFRMGDDEIDYRFWNELTGSDSKDRKILDTPVFEAFTNENIALRNPLITIRNARLQFLPKFTAKPSAIELKEQTDSVGGGVDVIVSQDISRSQTILPAEIIDVNYSIEVDNDLLFVHDEVPVSISPFGTSKYIVGAVPGRVTSAGGTELKFNLRVQTLTTEAFDVLVGASVAKPRTIPATVVITGQQSGMNLKIPVTITEFATS